MVNILFGNNKGGVGKTYVTVQIAHALAAKGLKVAVVDLDPQANASRQLGWKFDPAQPVATISEAIQTATAGLASQVTVATQKWDGEETAIDLLPSRHDLENRISEAATVGAVRRLVKVLDGWQDQYDVVLIDTPHLWATSPNLVSPLHTWLYASPNPPTTQSKALSGSRSLSNNTQQIWPIPICALVASSSTASRTSTNTSSSSKVSGTKWGN